MQIIAGLKKEFMFFSRGIRLAGMILIMLALALSSPMLYKTTSSLIDRTSDIAETSGVDIMAESGMDFAQIKGMFNANTAITSSFSSITSVGLIVIMLILMPMAGGEQRKRYILMPKLAGLTSAGYVLPKFLLYPLFAFFLSGACGGLSFAVCAKFFGGEIDVGLAFAACLILGVYMLFGVSLYLFAGMSTSRPGIAVVYTVVGMNIVSLILQALQVGKYNPLALTSLADALIFKSTGTNPDSLYALTVDVSIVTDNNIAVSVISAVVLSLVFLFLTLFVMKAGEIDNTAEVNY